MVKKLTQVTQLVRLTYDLKQFSNPVRSNALNFPNLPDP